MENIEKHVLKTLHIFRPEIKSIRCYKWHIKSCNYSNLEKLEPFFIIFSGRKCGSVFANSWWWSVISQYRHRYQYRVLVQLTLQTSVKRRSTMGVKGEIFLIRKVVKANHGYPNHDVHRISHVEMLENRKWYGLNSFFPTEP